MENKVSSTQQNIPIAGIKDGIILLKDGGYRVILSVAALNYALKSEQEQNSLIFQYQSFLNSLHFPIQIVMQSKKLDLTPYIKKIKDISEKQTNELLKAQTTDYIDFVGQLVNMANIMKKSFYVVITYQPISLQKANFLEKIFKHENGPTLKVSESEYNHYKSELLERTAIAANGLGSMGLHCVQMNTEEIIELMYKIYNPDVYSKERITDIGELSNVFVASESEKGQSAASAGENKEPELIDNSAIVKERQKQEFQQKQREEEKSAEKAGGQPVKDAPAPAPSAAPPMSAPVSNIPPTPAAPASAEPPVQDNNNFGS